MFRHYNLNILMNLLLSRFLPDIGYMNLLPLHCMFLPDIGYMNLLPLRNNFLPDRVFYLYRHSNFL